MPFEKGKSGNTAGRPKGARGKHNAQRDITNAMNSGMSLEEIVQTLTEKVLDNSVGDAQRTKYLTMLIDLKKFLSKEELARIKSTKKDTPAGNTKAAPVTPIKTKFKQRQG